MIDENKTLWRVLRFSEKSLEEIKSILGQFDEKPGSTLEEIAFKVKWQAFLYFNQLVETILKFNQTLQVVTITSSKVYSSQELSNFKVLTLNYASEVQLQTNCSRTWNSSYSLDSYSSSTPFHPSPCQPPKSFSSPLLPQSRQPSDPFNLEEPTPHCSQTLKHLSCEIDWLSAEEEVLSLQIPKLEVLELREMRQQFPIWLLVPPNMKLFNHRLHSNIPSSKSSGSKIRGDGKSCHLDVLTFKSSGWNEQHWQVHKASLFYLFSEQERRSRKEDLK